MIVVPEPTHDIPERLKADNWAFHVLARSDDPAVKCLNIVNLVTNLKTSLEIGGSLGSTESAFFANQTLGANKAWNLYSQGQIGHAVEVANAVLSSVLFLVYDKRFTTAKSDSFVGASK